MSCLLLSLPQRFTLSFSFKIENTDFDLYLLELFFRVREVLNDIGVRRFANTLDLWRLFMAILLLQLLHPWCLLLDHILNLIDLNWVTDAIHLFLHSYSFGQSIEWILLYFFLAYWYFERLSFQRQFEGEGLFFRFITPDKLSHVSSFYPDFQRIRNHAWDVR